MKTMKTIKFLTIALAITSFIACDSDSDDLLPVVSITVEDLHAPQEGGQGQPISGLFTKFDFDTVMETDNETYWDIDFRSPYIIVNGVKSLVTTDDPTINGYAVAYIATGTMADVTEVDVNLFTQDSESGYAIISGSGNGWYTYAGPPTYLITPTPGRILVFKTADGKYAKLKY